jgi:hypothetical protein
MDDEPHSPGTGAGSLSTYVELGLQILEDAQQGPNVQQGASAAGPGSNETAVISKAAKHKQAFLERVVNRLTTTGLQREQSGQAPGPAVTHERTPANLALLMRCVRLMGPVEYQRRYLTR